MYSGNTTTMSETDRARERLDFEAAAEAIEKGEWSTDDPSSQQGMNFLGGDSRFVSSSTVEVIASLGLFTKLSYSFSPISVLVKMLLVMCSTRNSKFQKLRRRWWIKFTQKEKNFSGVLLRYCASALTLLILLWERYFWFSCFHIICFVENNVSVRRFNI